MSLRAAILRDLAAHTPSHCPILEILDRSAALMAAVAVEHPIIRDERGGFTQVPPTVIVEE